MKKTAFLFPGQGSQAVGMGLDFYQEYDVVRELFDMAEEISKINISKLCFNGPMEDLTQTFNLQPAVTAVNLTCLTIIEKEDVTSDICAGHSLGEYSALVAAGIPIRIVPGITAGIGGLAYAGIPLTHRDVNQTVTFLTGHDQTGDAPGDID